MTGLVFLLIAAEKQHIVFSAVFRRTAVGRLNVARRHPARSLLADPARLARGDGNHPAWRGMYLLMAGAQVGTTLAYLR